MDPEATELVEAYGEFNVLYPLNCWSTVEREADAATRCPAPTAYPYPHLFTEP